MADKILNEIASVRSYFEARSACGKLDPALQKSFADNLIKMLGNVSDMSTPSANKMIASMQDAPYGETHTKRILDAIDAQLTKTLNTSTATPGKSGKSKNPVGSQKPFLKDWWNYLTEEQWERFLDKSKSINSKMVILRETANAVGIGSSVDEQTWKWALALLLLAHYDELPKARAIYDKLQDLKEVFNSESKSFGLAHIDAYPEDPKDLPEATFNHAFGDAAPVPKTFNGINSVAKCIPLRFNSKLLNDNAAAHKQARLAFGGSGVKLESGANPVKLERGSSNVSAIKSEQPFIKTESPKVSVTCVDEERQLMEKYQNDLAKLRCKKLESSSSVQLERADDGSIVLHSRTPSIPLTCDTNPEVKHDSSVGVDASGVGGASQPVEPPRPEIPLNSLDPFTQAAIQALENRKQQKADDKVVAKRPAGVGGPVKIEPPTKQLKRELLKPKVEPKLAKGGKKKGKRLTKSLVEVCKAKIRSQMPKKLPSDGSNPPPVAYNGGIIYTSRKTNNFRALTERGNNNSEKSRSWKGAKPSQAAWNYCVKAIDASKK